jgi:imidazolonepropionase-like amidohydrolase
VTVRVIVRNGTALVGPSLEAVELGELRVRDGKVVEIDRRGAEAPPAGEEGEKDWVIDASGAYVLPALVDAHVHLSLSGGPVPFAAWKGDREERLAQTLVSGLRCLAAGIAAVRDLGCPDTTVIDYGRLVEDGLVVGPRVVAAGAPIAAPNGHIFEYSRVADGAEDVRWAAEEQLAAGSSVIKLMASGGFTSGTDPLSSAFTPHEMGCAVEVAHAIGVPVAAHAHSDASVRSALEAGVDTIEHAAYASQETHERIVEAGATLVPTLYAVVAANAEQSAAGLERIARFRESVRTAIGAGVPIAAGTDAGTSNNPAGGLLQELLEYREQGMSDHEALRSATVVAGGLIGDGVGVLEVGARADLVVVPADPRADVSVLSRIASLIVGGRVIDRPRLMAALGHQRA